MQVAFDNTQLVRVISSRSSWMSRLHFLKNGRFGGISVSQTHRVFHWMMKLLQKLLQNDSFAVWIWWLKKNYPNAGSCCMIGIYFTLSPAIIFSFMAVQLMKTSCWGTQHFLLSWQCFKKAYFSWSLYPAKRMLSVVYWNQPVCPSVYKIWVSVKVVEGLFSCN